MLYRYYWWVKLFKEQLVRPQPSYTRLPDNYQEHHH